MPTNAQGTAKTTVRKSFVVTFDNHPPIRLWGDFDAETVARHELPVSERGTSRIDGAGAYLSDYEDGCVWDRNPQWGHNDVCYYITKSGKRLYWGSYNSGESYGGRSPKTSREFLKTVDDIKNYIINHSDVSEWNRVSHRVDVSLIVDSDLL
jgi:hypothetical protein